MRSRDNSGKQKLRLFSANEIFSSAQMQREQILLKENLCLQNALKNLDEFTTHIAHDLQAPLRTINLHLELIEMELFGKNDLSKNEKCRESFNTVKKISSRLNQMVIDTLFYARVTNDVSFDDVDLKQIVIDVMDNLQADIISQDVTIEIGDLPKMQGNRTLLIQVFQNLISNSLKYRKKETDLVIKIASFDVDEKWHQIVFEDNGIGIENAYQENIFNMFSKIDYDSEGSGVGLALVDKIVRFLGGEVFLESRLNEGTKVFLNLPVTLNIKDAN